MLTAFNWIIDGKLAGSGRPGLLAELDEDMAFLEEQGIRTIVTLTEDRVDDLDAFAGFEILHFPIPDMGFPTPRVAASICEQILAGMADKPVLLHCRAGLGRTGTVAACCLVALGEQPDRALARVRCVNPRYVQTRAQEQFISHFFAHLETRDSR
ncbi:MAG: tyrosine-protein phosphatase [Enhygromyxa sp.]